MEIGRRLERLRIDEREVVDVDAAVSATIFRISRSTASTSWTPCVDASSPARSARCSTGASCPLLGRQVAVARRHRQAVVLAHGLAEHEPHRDVEIAHHALDHRALLRVLAAERRRGRAARC